MTETISRRPRNGGTSPISFDVRVDRMEIVRHGRQHEGDDIKWNVYLYPVPAGDIPQGPNYIMVGHLFREASGGHAQVRATALIRAFSDKDVPLDVSYVHGRLSYGFVEPIYDTCRRMLNSQAAIMDIDLEIPVASPAANVELKELKERKAKKSVASAEG